jgi:signal transduction histidine kinase
MFGSQPITTAVAAAMAAVVVGFLALWSNPQRGLNRGFFTGSIHVALWLVCLELAVNGGSYGQFWLRMSCAVGAFLPLHLWFIKETIVSDAESRRTILRRCAGLLIACAALSALTLTEWFVATESSREATGFGWGYRVYIIGVITVYAGLSYQTLRQSREQVGVNRLELQTVLFGGSLSALAVLLLMALRDLLHMPVLVQVQPWVVLCFYTATAIAITTKRIFDARQILLVGLQKFTLIGLVAAAAFLLDTVFEQFLVEPFAFIVTTALALWLAAELNGLLDRFFQFYPQATAARQAAFDAASRETRIDSLEKAFLTVLKGWGHTDHAIILSGAKDALRGGGLELAGDATVLGAMRSLRWATPERLARERPTPARDEVARFLRQHALGALVIGEGPTLTVLLGVGVAASRRPLTYPQVTQLQELASIVESALERAHFSVKVQHAEQLATVGLLGASLAHEIRNPLVTIKTFVQLLPQHHQDAAFRDKFFRLIGDEVGRIDRLTEQLLDLATPRAYAAELVDLHPMLRASVDLVAAKAADRDIRFLTEFKAAPDKVFTDGSAAKQVMLNLCFNAIQAAESSASERWVKVSTSNTANGVEMAVADSGPGISPEIRPRLFQPFQTTKSSGFGLGLAICSDILANLHATITVDPPMEGCGATFRVIFPCQPLSS